MADKVFGADFNNNTSPAGTSTISVNNGTTLEDVVLSDLLSFASLGTPRNVLINGDMQVAQRGTSVASITTNGYYTLDRWTIGNGTLGTWTMSQQLDAPSGTPFRQSLKVLVTTADGAPAAGDIFNVRQFVEGQFCQGFLKGTSSARQFAVQFWVKSNLTGTYIAEVLDTDNTRQVSASYTINAANTWEKKTIVFPADTTGAFDNDNNASLQFTFWLAAGSNFTSGTLNTSWAATTTANRAVGQTNLAATINNYFQVTGVQLEANSTQTQFESKNLDMVMSQCQRYYQKTFPYATVPAQNAGVSGVFTCMAGKAGAATEFGDWRFPVKMRSTPATITFYNPLGLNAQVRDLTAAADCSATASVAAHTNEDKILFSATGNAGTAVGDILGVHITADAEL